LSQRDIAAMLGISQKWVWEMEQGKPGILLDRLFKMLSTTGIVLYAKFEVNDGQEDEAINGQGDQIKSGQKNVQP